MNIYLIQKYSDNNQDYSKFMHLFVYFLFVLLLVEFLYFHCLRPLYVKHDYFDVILYHNSLIIKLFWSYISKCSLILIHFKFSLNIGLYPRITLLNHINNSLCNVFFNSRQNQFCGTIFDKYLLYPLYLSQINIKY